MNHEPPESGTRPMPMKPGTKLAASDAMRMSHAHASESPAPAAGPLTAASTGLASARIALMFGWYDASSRSRIDPSSCWNSRRSCPAEKPAPGAGDHHGAHRPSAASASASASAACSAAVEGVEDVGSVERDRQHCPFPAVTTSLIAGTPGVVEVHLSLLSRNALIAPCASSPSIDSASHSRAWPTVWCQARSRQTLSCCLA